MDEEYFEDEKFVKVNYASSPLAKATYEGCKFEHCIFSDADLSSIQFIDCVFEDCDFSLAHIKNTSMRDARFVRCKMLGLRFEDCNSFLFSVGFDHCILNHSSFFNVSMKKTIIKNSSCKEVYFTGADLSGSILTHTDFSLARFDQTNLEKADLRSAIHYSIDPENNKIKKAKFSIEGLAGLLDRYGIDIS